MKGGNIILSCTVYKVQKKRKFVVVDANYLKRKDLSLKAKGLLTQVLSLPAGWKFSESGLVSICSESKTAVISALKELETYGYFRKIKCRNEKGQFFYTYIFFEHPRLQDYYNQMPPPE